MKSHENNFSFTRFLIVWFGQFISSVGSGLTSFALGVYVFHKTGSSAYYSLVLLASFLPAIALKPIGGTLADRFDRKSLMIIGDIGAAFGVALIIYLLQQGINDLWVVYVGAVISSIFVALQNPAYKASVTDLVAKEFYAKSSGLMQLTESSKYIFSPIIAGVLMTYLHIQYVLMIDCATFLVAILCVLLIKKSSPNYSKEHSQEKLLDDLKYGFKYVVHHRGIFSLLLIISVATFFVGVLQALIGPMILVFATPKVLGNILTIAACGMLISSIFIGTLSDFNKKIPILAISLFWAGIFFSFIGISQNIVVITLAAFMFFLALPFVNTCLDVLIRGNVDNKIQGRVWAIVSLISQIGMLIAFAISGFLADYIFNPLLQADGLLATSIGKIIGVGEGRGIALMFVISGIFIAIIAVFIAKLPALKKLEAEVQLSGFDNNNYKEKI